MDETQVSTAPETLNPAPELAATPEVATPESEATEQPKEPDQADKALKGLHRRIDRLTAARYQEQARAEQAAREAEQLRQRLAQYETAPEREELTPDKVLPIARHMAEQLKEQDKVRESVSTVLTRGKTLEGFDSACNTVNEVLPFYTNNGAPTTFLRAVLEGETPERVLHYLGTNPDVVEELAGLSPTQVARRLDRIEQKLSAPAAPQETQAPKPIAPLKGSATGTKDPSQMSDREFAEWRKRQIAQRR